MLWLLTTEVPKTLAQRAHSESFWGRRLLNRTNHKVLDGASDQEGHQSPPR